MRGGGIGVAAAALAVVSALAGCSSDPAAEPASPATSTADQEADAPEITTTTVPAPLDLAQTFTTAAGNELTVYEYRPNTPNSEPGPEDVLPDGMIWASADVELCRSTDDVARPVDADSWQLRTEAGGRIQIASSIYRNALVPEWSFTTAETPIVPGDCLRGWALFEVPAEETIEAIVFTNTDDPLPQWSL